MSFRDYRNRGTKNVSDPIHTRLDARRLGSAYGVTLVATEWRRAEHPERAEGFTPYFAIEFLRVGSFEKRGRRRAFVDAKVAVGFDRDERFEVRHPYGDENSGLTVRFEPEAWEACGARTRRGNDPGTFVVPAALHLALERVAARLSSSDRGDELREAEDLVSLAQASITSSRASNPERGAATRSDRDRADRVRAYLTAQFAGRVTLFDVAAAAGCSPWHVSKTFRRATGATVHGWLNGLRLRHALAALRDGEVDLTALALRVGFSSHSHFTAAFRREFGLTPRAARVALRAAPFARLAGFRRPGERR